MRRVWNGRTKYECAHTYLNTGDWHERNAIIDVDIEAAVLAALQKECDMQVETRRLAEEKKTLAQTKAAEAEKCL